jgi:hypothetical protein
MEMAAAEAPVPMATMAPTAGGAVAQAQSVVQSAAGRTFFLRDGVWVDSAYDAADMGEPQTIDFASDAYFELLSVRPELGQALALGEEIILVVDSAAYRITNAGGETPQAEVTLPAPATAPLDRDAPVNQTGSQPAGDTGSQTGVGVRVCGVPLLLPLVALMGWGMTYRRRRR